MKRICVQCGAAFDAKSYHRRYCSTDCKRNGKSTSMRPHKKSEAVKPKPEPPSRELSNDTVYLIHKWIAEGDRLKDVAELLDRPESDIQAALDTKISRRDWLAIQKNFILTRRKRK